MGLPDNHLCGVTGWRNGDCVPCRACWDRLLERGLGEKLLASALLTALSHHPQDWQVHDLEELVVDIDNGSDEPSFTWVLKAGGQWMAVRGWHDYTGWDCQSGLRTEKYATKEDALRTLVDWEREAIEQQAREAR